MEKLLLLLLSIISFSFADVNQANYGKNEKLIFKNSDNSYIKFIANKNDKTLTKKKILKLLAKEKIKNKDDYIGTYFTYIYLTKGKIDKYTKIIGAKYDGDKKEIIVDKLLYDLNKLKNKRNINLNTEEYAILFAKMIYYTDKYLICYNKNIYSRLLNNGIKIKENFYWKNGNTMRFLFQKQLSFKNCNDIKLDGIMWIKTRPEYNKYNYLGIEYK